MANKTEIKRDQRYYNNNSFCNGLSEISDKPFDKNTQSGCHLFKNNWRINSIVQKWKILAQNKSMETNYK